MLASIAKSIYAMLCADWKQNSLATQTCSC